MSNSVLSNTALENKSLTPAQTKSKITFSQDKITLSGQTSGTRCLVSNVAEPVASTDCATKSYVDTKILDQNVGLSWKNPVEALQTSALPANTFSSGTIEAFSNGALSAGVFDNVTLQVGDRVIVNEQSTASQNGIYEVASLGAGDAKFSFNRTADGDTASELQSATMAVKQGDTYGSSTWTESKVVETLDTDDVKFVQLSTGINETATTDGLQKVGKFISIKTDNTRGIGIVDDKVAVIDSGISTTQLADDCITQAKISDGSILSNHILAGSCIEATLGAGAVTNTKLGALAVTADKLASNAVESAKIKPANVLSSHIGDDQLLSNHYLAGSVDADAIGIGEVNSTHIAQGQLLQTHYSANSVNESALAPSAVTNSIIANNAVTTGKIAGGNVTTAKLDQTLGTEAVTTECIRDGQITLPKMAVDSVDTSQVKDNAVIGAKLADNCIGDRHIGVINNLSINGEVSAASFNAGGVGGTTSMSLARVKFYNVDFQANGAYDWTSSWTKLPHNDSVVSFSFEDAILMSSTLTRLIVSCDQISNQAELITAVRYYNADGSMANDVVVSTYQVVNTVAGNSDQEISYPSLQGNGDDKIAEISTWVRKGVAGGVLQCPANSDFFMSCMVVSENSSRIQKYYNNNTFS